MVSICCITYNHAPFIRQAIDGFLMQKTTFPFEIIIHDDASTDGTQKIIKEYTSKYPKIIRPILQKKNQYYKGLMKGTFNGYEPLADFILPKAKGKYIALCEGDDYWTDPTKLQKQIDFLEHNPDFVMSYHKCNLLVGSEFRSYCSDGKDYTADELIETPSYIHTATKVFRNVFNSKTQKDFRDFSGDILLTCYLGTYGKCKFHPEIAPSIYRIHPNGVWSGKSDIQKWILVNNLNDHLYELFVERGDIRRAEIRKKFIRKEKYYGVIISTYQREDGKTPAYLKRCLDSVFHQTHQYFKVYIIGDKYEDSKELNQIVGQYSKDKFYLKNLPQAKEREKYRGINSEALWCAGGVNATNYGTTKALEDQIKYVCYLDHDDYWMPDHLETINRVIHETMASWVCTSTRLENYRFLPTIPVNNFKYKSFLPLPQGIIKSSVCMNINEIPLRPRDVCAETGKPYPGDADLWARCSEYIKDHHLRSYFINKQTCVHDKEGYVRAGNI